MKRILTITLVLLPTFFFYPNPHEQDQLMYTGSGIESLLPSAIVNNTVDVVSGTYLDTCNDLTVLGPDPLSIDRHYHFSRREFIAAYRFEDFGIGTAISHPYKVGGYSQRGVLEKNGTFCLFSRNDQLKKMINNHDYTTYLVDDYYEKGFSNVNISEMSGQTNLKNYYLYSRRFGHKEEEYQIFLPSGAIRYYYTPKIRALGQKFYLLKEKLPTGNILKYEYTPDWKLSTISLKDSTEKRTFSSLKFLYKDNEDKVRAIRASDGRIVEYEYAYDKQFDMGYQGDLSVIRNFDSWPIIKKVSYSDKPSDSYTYSSDSFSLTKKKETGDYLETHFLREGSHETTQSNNETIFIDSRYVDPRYKKVNYQYAPYGPNGEKVRIASFHYEGNCSNRRFNSSHQTHYYDAYDNQTIYTFTEQGRISSIQFFQKTNKQQRLLKEERYFWAGKDEQNSGDLIAKATLDEKSRVISGYFLSYDKQNNLKEKHSYGNLTGRYKTDIILDERGVPKNKGNNLELFSTYFFYSKDNQLIKKCEGRLVYLFDYYKTNRKLKKALIKDKKNSIISRTFYFYDQNACLIKKVEDNGDEEELASLKGVSFRKTEKYSLTQQAPIGLLEKIQEYYWDPSTNKNLLKKTKAMSYDKWGRIIRVNTYDPSGKLYSTASKKYNKYGQVIQEVDEEGNISTKTYSSSGLLQGEISNSGLTNKHYYYDQAGRCTQVVDLSLSHKKKPLKKMYTHFSYNKKNQVIKEFDHNGLTKQYTYDALGNRTEATTKSINIAGKQTDLIEKKSYDALGNLTKEVDPAGLATTYSYNANQKKTFAKYPDGSSEQWEYYLDGNLHQHISIEGITTKYTYDAQSRVCKIEVFDTYGKRQKVTQNIYNSSHLIKTIHPDGKVTKYEYDCFGRKSKELDGSRKIKVFTYDFMDRVTVVKEYLDKDMQDYVLEEYCYDKRNRIIKTLKKNSKGAVQRRVDKRYNASSDVILEKLYQNHSTASNYLFYYNGRGQLEEEIDPLGHTSNYSYDPKFITYQGSLGAMKKSTDPMGNYVLEQYNLLGQLIRQETFSRKKQCLKSTTFSYNLQGLMFKQEDKVLKGKLAGNTFTILLDYDPQGRVLSISEGIKNFRKTRFKYDPQGRLIKKVLPSNKQLQMEYDGLSRLKSRLSGKIKFLYSYDNLDRLLCVKEYQHDSLISTSRYTLDEYGRIRKEIMANGLQVGYQLDNLDRPLEYSLPVSGSINYAYNGYNLAKIDRKSSKNYSISLDKYSWQGRAVSISFDSIHEKQEIHLDLLGRRTLLASDIYREEIPEHGFDPCGNLKHFIQDEEEKFFSYDHLLRLIKEEREAGECSYDYDSLGNRIKRDEHEFEVDEFNQLIYDGVFHYQYDKDGNLISRDKLAVIDLQFKYDPFGRLIQIEQPKVSKKELSYDYQDRLVSIKEHSFDREINWYTAEVEKHLLYFGDFEVGAIENNRLTELKVITPRYLGDIGATQAVEKDEQVYFAFNDYQGSIKKLVSLESKEVFSWSYSAYGEIEAEQESFKLPWKYLSKRELSPGYYFFGKRLYSSHLGRFISKDPKGISEGSNPYAFADNRPFFYTDIQGFSKTSVESDSFPIATTMIPDPFLIIQAINDSGVVEKIENSLGFHHDQSVVIHPHTDSSHHKAPNIIFVNGIMNTNQESGKSTDYLLSLSPQSSSISNIRNYSFNNLPLDIIKCGMEKIGIKTRPVRDLERVCLDFFKQAEETERLLVIAHSGGNIVSKLAFEGLSESIRNRIDFVGIAPGSYISRDLIPNSNLFVGNDLVPLIGGVVGNRSNITYLHKDGSEISGFRSWYYGSSGAWPLASRIMDNGFQHSFQSPSYEKALGDTLNNFNQREFSENYMQVNVGYISRGF
ncbi:MAG: hypothetical protein L7U87_02365 [Chlamydiales bacterium]|nr:hypothetical protein [Chlamydiales bacterium]